MFKNRKRYFIVLYFFSNCIAFSQNVEKDTMVVIEPVLITNKKHKLKTIKSKIPKRVKYEFSSDTPNYYLINNFPAGKIIQIELYSFNYKKYMPFKGEFCEDEEHSINIYSITSNKENELLPDKLIFSKSFLLPIENSKAKAPINIDLSYIDFVSDKFFIQFTSNKKTIEAQDCQISTNGFNVFNSMDFEYYSFDKNKNFIKKKGLEVEIKIKVLTSDY